MQQPLGDRLDEPEIPPAEGPPAVDTEALPSLEVHNMLEGGALPWAVALLLLIAGVTGFLLRTTSLNRSNHALASATLQLSRIRDQATIQTNQINALIALKRSMQTAVNTCQKASDEGAELERLAVRANDNLTKTFAEVAVGNISAANRYLGAARTAARKLNSKLNRANSDLKACRERLTTSG